MSVTDLASLFPGFIRRRIATSGTEINLVVGGEGPPVLMLHGWPESHRMWHKVAPALAERFTVVCADLRGYGDSGKPPGGPDHAPYAKREMARDMVEVMGALGFDRFRLVSHDRGARVSYRMALDQPERVDRLVLMDIIPTGHYYDTVTAETAKAYFHWFFFLQPSPFPEMMIGPQPDLMIRGFLRAAGPTPGAFDPAIVQSYIDTARHPEAVHAMCEDYRAGYAIDRLHDAADRQAGRRITCPTLLLWGSRGLVGRAYDPLAVWGDWCTDLRGQALECGHFLPEEKPAEVLAALEAFL